MTHQSRLTRRGFSASALLGLSLALAAAISPAAAENKVGVAAAVNPDAFSSLSGAPKSQLNIGKSIFFNERIATTTSGLVQVLLVDGSTFTVGPDSDLVIDKFVYDANKGTGQIAASFSKGVMRFVGGKISKSDNAVTIKTPAGAMAVRGCIVLTQVTQSNFAAVLVYGDYLKMKNFIVYEPGNGVFISGSGIGEVRKATGADIGSMVAGLSSSNTQSQNGDASNKSSNPGTVIQLVDTASLSELIQNANTQMVVSDSTKVEVPPPVVVPPPCVGAECNPPPPPPCEGIECGTARGQLNGYAGGGWVTQDHTEDDGEPVNAEYGTLANHSAEDVSFTFNEDGDSNADNDSFSAKFRLHVAEPGAPSEGGILMNFGDKAPPTNPEDRFSFIDPETGGFFAFNGPDDPNDPDELDGITIFHDNDEKGKVTGEPFAFLASHEVFTQSPANGNDVQSLESHEVPEGFALPELCSDCDFLKWGVFGTKATFEETDDSGEPNQRDVGILGFWVAGDIAAVGDLPFTGSATYTGGAVGTVTTDLFNEGEVQTYTARGDMRMDWDFAARNGDLKVSKFDQQNFGEDGIAFGGKMCAPGATQCGGKEWKTPDGNHFGGRLESQRGNNPNEPSLNGFALGSFARGDSNYDNTGKPIKGSTPEGVIGNWQVGTGPDAPAGSRYEASGVFAGKNRPR